MLYVARGQMALKLPNHKYVPKSYEQMTYPGQRVQINVKFVPKSCLIDQAAEDGAIINTRSWTNTVVFAIWMPFRNTAPISPPSSSSIVPKSFPMLSSVSRQTTARNLKRSWCKRFPQKMFQRFQSGIFHNFLWP